MASGMSADDARRSVAADIERFSHTGAPPMGHLAGLHRVPSEHDLFALAFDLARPAMAGGPGILEVAMLADLALGGVLRNRIGLALPMPTISMTIQLAPGQASRVAWADSEVGVLTARTATARGRLRAGTGEVIGDAQGVFALPSLPCDRPGRSMPWDIWEHPATVETPVAASGSLVDEVAAHAFGDPSQAWGSAHIARHLSGSGGTVAMTPTTPMANRLGHTQGGALFTSAIVAAERGSGFTAGELVTATIEFLDAAQLDTPVIATASILRESRRSLFASIALRQGQRPCCHVSAVFRR
jgi:acyl-coenzyme A thioesterase PaaI-like protein